MTAQEQDDTTADLAAELVALPPEAEIRAEYFARELGPAALGPADPDATLILHGDDLRLAHWTEKVVAAVHGDRRVLDLPSEEQERIARVSRAFEVHAGGILRNRETDEAIRGSKPCETARRAAVALIGNQERDANPVVWESEDGPVPPAGPAGTPMRCPKCQRIHHPLTDDVDWGIAGREDITCPACVEATPKHAAKPAVVKPAPAKPATRKRAPRRKPTGATA
jgi:hypothetical protein